VSHTLQTPSADLTVAVRALGAAVASGRHVLISSTHTYTPRLTASRPLSAHHRRISHQRRISLYYWAEYSAVGHAEEHGDDVDNDAHAGREQCRCLCGRCGRRRVQRRVSAVQAEWAKGAAER